VGLRAQTADEHVAARAHRQGDGGVLLDDQHRYLAADRGERTEQLAAIRTKVEGENVYLLNVRLANSLPADVVV